MPRFVVDECCLHIDPHCAAGILHEENDRKGEGATFSFTLMGSSHFSDEARLSCHPCTPTPSWPPRCAAKALSFKYGNCVTSNPRSVHTASYLAAADVDFGEEAKIAYLLYGACTQFDKEVAAICRPNEMALPARWLVVC